MALLTEFYQMVKDMVTGKYPDYVMRNRRGDEIPVFVYHHVNKKYFGEQLQFLKNNGYQTLNMLQLDQILSKELKPSAKDIILTFDDGLEDLYSVVYPMLRFYQFQGIAFIAPYWIGEKGMINWQQVVEMHQSGAIDFQAHSYTHGRIYISPKIIDFFYPGFRYRYRWQFPLLNNGSDYFEKQLPPFGMPIYQFSSSLTESKRYLGDSALEKFCTECVKNRGGKLFFKNPFWGNQLKKAVRLFLQDKTIKDKYETEEEQSDRIKKEIELPKVIIEEKLPDKKVIAFSYPYFEWSKITNRLLKECGYQYVFGGVKKDFVFNSSHVQIQFFRRVNGDFIKRLRGKGRISLCHLLFLKVWRRLKRVSTS